MRPARIAGYTGGCTLRRSREPSVPEYRVTRFVALFPALVLLAACEPATGPTPLEERIIGVIAVAGDTTTKVLVVPDSARAGTGFQVTVTTFGNGCDRAGEVEVEMRGLVATLHPYDYTRRDAAACDPAVRRFPRSTTLTFAERGDALVRVQGRRIGPGTPPGGAMIQIERSVRVR